MFLWVVNVFYLSAGRNVLYSLLLLRVVWLMSSRYFKRISALHPILQSCSCFSNNRNSSTDSGVAPWLLQFMTSIAMKADIHHSLHISQSTFAYVATNTVSLILLLGSTNHCIQLRFQFGWSELEAVWLWCLCVQALSWEQHKLVLGDLQGMSSERCVLVRLRTYWNYSFNIYSEHSFCILTEFVDLKSFLII